VPRNVRILSGSDLAGLLTLADVVPAVEPAYLAASRQDALLYPVVREPLQASGGVFGIKSRLLARPWHSRPESCGLLAGKQEGGP
jgi:hypothetical protein